MEAIAVFSVAVNVLTLVDLACGTINRIKEYTDAAHEVPSSLRSTTNCLPVLAAILNRAKEQGMYDRLELRNMLGDFNRQLQVIETHARNVIPLPTDTRKRRLKKAFKSLREEKQIQQAKLDINDYQTTLTLSIVSTPVLPMAVLTTVNKARTGFMRQQKYFNFPVYPQWMRAVLRAFPESLTIYSMIYYNLAEAFVKSRSQRLLLSEKDPNRWTRKDITFSTIISFLFANCIDSPLFNDLMFSQFCADIQTSGAVDIIIYVNIMKQYNPGYEIPVSLEEYMHFFNIPRPSSLVDCWDAFTTALEGWDRTFMLIVDVRPPRLCPSLPAAQASSLRNHAVSSVLASKFQQCCNFSVILDDRGGINLETTADRDGGMDGTVPKKNLDESLEEACTEATNLISAGVGEIVPRMEADSDSSSFWTQTRVRRNSSPIDLPLFLDLFIADLGDLGAGRPGRNPEGSPAELMTG